MQNIYCDEILYRLGFKQQSLVARYIDLGMFDVARCLNGMDDPIYLHVKSQRTKLDFVGHIMSGQTLLVGEGNLSFAYSLSQKQRINPKNLFPTTFEQFKDLSDSARLNATALERVGATVLHGINATQLHRHFENQRFEHIVFQFPHSGSREPIHGQNPNAVLVNRFLKSAVKLLAKQGSVLISAVDSPHYLGAFQCSNAAMENGFGEPELYRFTPSDFPHYTHTMTLEEGSALAQHDAFVTWVFKRK